MEIDGVGHIASRGIFGKYGKPFVLFVLLMNVLLRSGDQFSNHWLPPLAKPPWFGGAPVGVMGDVLTQRRKWRKGGFCYRIPVLRCDCRLAAPVCYNPLRCKHCRSSVDWACQRRRKGRFSLTLTEGAVLWLRMARMADTPATAR